MRDSLRALAVSPTAVQVAKFAIVGFLNVAVSFVVFYTFFRVWPIATIFLGLLGDSGSDITAVLVENGIGALDATFANVVGYIAGIINSFILNKIWTFQAEGDVTRQIHRFFVLNILGLAMSTIIIFLFVDLLNAPYLLVWLIAIGIVMILNFLGQRHWAFADGLPSNSTS